MTETSATQTIEEAKTEIVAASEAQIDAAIAEGDAAHRVAVAASQAQESAAVAAVAASGAVAIAETQAAIAKVEAAQTIAENEGKMSWLESQVNQLTQTVSAMSTDMMTVLSRQSSIESELAALKPSTPPPSDEPMLEQPAVAIVAPEDASAGVLPAPPQEPQQRVKKFAIL